MVVASNVLLGPITDSLKERYEALVNLGKRRGSRFLSEAAPTPLFGLHSPLSHFSFSNELEACSVEHGIMVLRGLAEQLGLNSGTCIIRYDFSDQNSTGPTSSMCAYATAVPRESVSQHQSPSTRRTQKGSTKLHKRWVLYDTQSWAVGCSCSGGCGTGKALHHQHISYGKQAVENIDDSEALHICPCVRGKRACNPNCRHVELCDNFDKDLELKCQVIESAGEECFRVSPKNGDGRISSTGGRQWSWTAPPSEFESFPSLVKRPPSNRLPSPPAFEIEDTVLSKR